MQGHDKEQLDTLGYGGYINEKATEQDKFFNMCVGRGLAKYQVR